ncbi:hypothetical protein N7513_004811 [Penicillium frequentans]|nr:hypothetical protein N7513_004811 [Penicillium glabrum]
MSVTIHPREPPPMGELATIIQKSLESNFANATARVVDCPDLREPPSTSLQPDSPEIHALLISDMQMLPTGGSIIGAGAAPFYDIGHNAELAPNIAWSSEADVPEFDIPSSLRVVNRTRVIDVNTEGLSSCHHATSTNCALMMNLYGSTGDPGQVLKISARGRKGDHNFTNCIRLGLRDFYGDSNPISLGGVFLLKSGKAKFHVMPDFPKDLPFRDREQLEREWLTYHVFDAPVVCLTVMHSADPESLGLRMEHTHCFDAGGSRKGGHYHYDVPGEEEVEYEAYLHPASTFYN